MHRAAALLSVVCVMAPAFAGESLSMREYEERCASYYAQEYGVSPALVRAIIQIESAWQAGVVSSKGAMGLMQLMPDTWVELSARYELGLDPFDPRDN